ncbi:MAG: hypothetical protein K2X97_04480, partial [Mycobacteriaceae bacterium]|nr:hypothetical protein [Mycobacteriaceae bacterium]
MIKTATDSAGEAGYTVGAEGAGLPKAAGPTGRGSGPARAAEPGSAAGAADVRIATAAGRAGLAEQPAAA